MKFERGIYIRGSMTGFAFGAVMLSGTAFAGLAAPEIDPGMAVGGLTVLGVGIALLIERYRQRG